MLPPVVYSVAAAATALAAAVAIAVVEIARFFGMYSSNVDRDPIDVFCYQVVNFRACMVWVSGMLSSRDQHVHM